MKASKKNNSAGTSKKINPAPLPKPEKLKIHSIFFFIVEVVLIFLILAGIVYYVEKKGYFLPDGTNDHTKRKWDSFYNFTPKNNVDILIIGNSHAYTGINPKNLSEALGVNAFILAAPGTTSIDSYYCMEEAISATKPKVVIMETYGISGSVQHELTGAALSDQIQSFSARKNSMLKLKSMPVLFKVDNYLYAWSSFLRNHNFIFTNRQQIVKNKELLKKRQPLNSKLYLGRFVRWQTGIEEPTLERYETEGAPVNGNDYWIGKEAEQNIRRLTRLCKENDIKLLFFTIPMYYKHIANYDTWRNILGEALDKFSPGTDWLDLQQPYDTTLFTKECFENTYAKNQHTTYYGSLITTYKLARYIRDSMEVTLPNRAEDKEWHKMFYGEEGYFENYSPAKNDTTCRILFEELQFDSIRIKEMDIQHRKEANLLLAKVDTNIAVPNLINSRLNCLVEIQTKEGQRFFTWIGMPIDRSHLTLNHYLFTSYINKEVEVKRIIQCQIVN